MVPDPNATADASVARDLEAACHHTAPREGMGAIGRATTLQELQSQLEGICARTIQLVDSAGPELCAKPPRPGAWSVAECLQHLNLSTDAYFPIWQQIIASAGPRRTERDAPYHTDFWGRLLSWILEPPPRVRSKTLTPFEPVNCGEVEQVLEGFVTRQHRIIATLHRCRGRAIDQVKMASPINARIRYSIWSSFIVNAAHQRRHLWQAEQAIQHLRGGL